MGRWTSGLDLPCAASLASSSACSFGEKSIWPGVQWIWRSMVSHLRVLQSWLMWSFSVASCTWSRR